MNYKYFKKEEFACKCGCGYNPIDETLVRMLDESREYAKVPFVINSGCRCEKHNNSIGGSKTSSHLKGLAVDIRVRNDNERMVMVECLIASGFNRIGIAKNFIHVDIDQKKANNRMWVY